MLKKIGLIVNPKAGVGGSAGLKGSDGEDIYKEAIKRGAVEKAPLRVKECFKHLTDCSDKFILYTAGGKLGEDEIKDSGYKYETVYRQAKEESSAYDTKKAVSIFNEMGVDIIVFAGGDGTARDVYDGNNKSTAVIGIPAGTKMHSAVFAVSPKAAADILRNFIEDKNYQIVESEVMDIDEEEFRNERLSAKLYGYLNVLVVGNMVQALKSPVITNEKTNLEGIGQFVAEEMQEDILYIIGTGSSLKPVMDSLSLPNSLLGVDLVYNFKLIAKDVSEKEILEALKEYKKRKIIVTVIGGQGYIFGRGNQQISYKVINEVGKENIIIISTPSKLKSLKNDYLLVDTGDEDTNKYLEGYYRVITDYNYLTLMKVKNI